MQNKYKYESPIDTKILQFSLIVGMVAITSFGTTAGDLINKGLSKLPFQQQSTTTTQNKYQQASFDGNGKKWDLIWKQEGTGCQNWANDTANRGGAWFTCLGITQTAWTQYLRQSPSLNLPDRVEVAYRQLGSSEFKKHAILIYKQQYCKPVACDKYQGPLPALLMAISANGGPGVARRHLKNTENITNPKERAMAIAKLEHARYDRIAANNPSQRGFRRGGWQQNIDNRYEYIKQF